MIISNFALLKVRHADVHQLWNWRQGYEWHFRILMSVLISRCFSSALATSLEFVDTICTLLVGIMMCPQVQLVTFRIILFCPQVKLSNSWFRYLFYQSNPHFILKVCPELKLTNSWSRYLFECNPRTHTGNCDALSETSL